MASTVTKQTAEEMLKLHPTLLVNDDNVAQFQVMMESMSLYQEREAVRGGLWKEAGAKDSAHHLKSKAARVMFAIDHTAPASGLDDALDAVNYSAFYVRNVRAGRLVER